MGVFVGWCGGNGSDGVRLWGGYLSGGVYVVFMGIVCGWCGGVGDMFDIWW